MKKGFFKKVWYSTTKIEKYPELSAEGLKSSIKYLIILVLIIGLASSLVTVYRTSLKIKGIASYINERIPELTYSNETLQVETEEPIIDENDIFGKIIIDTNTEDEQKIEEYKNNENAIIILKNKIILQENGTAEYNYNELLGQVGITEFNKQNLVEYLNGKGIMNIYLSLTLSLFIYAFIIYLINTLFYIIIISIFGYIATMILKLKIRYVAVFNMGVYAITLPILLNIIYIIINAIFQFKITYFEILYALLASIYIMAAICMLKLEFNKKQGEVEKIVEVEKQEKEEKQEDDGQEESGL